MEDYKALSKISFFDIFTRVEPGEKEKDREKEREEKAEKKILL